MRPMNRRVLLVYAERLAALAGLIPIACSPGDLLSFGEKTIRFAANPFSLGIASGDPLPNGVVLWTRLAPDPLHGGGMPPEPVTVLWQLAADESMRRVVKQGTAVALPELAHSVHVEVDGLEPDRWYWYRFRAGSFTSPVGRTRTAPAPGARVERFRFAFASCQNWQDGYYGAYQHMAKEDLDLVVHLGDYIYESAVRENAVRRHDGPEPVTLEAYRRRYALYKSDPDLQAAHRAFPWIVTPDDHEVQNDYAGSHPQRGDPAIFLLRRAAAYQAYYEHQPLRHTSIPHGPDIQLYRRLRFGSLVEFNVLDTRQYRSPQPSCQESERLDGFCPAALDPHQTILGAAQRRWLLDGLTHSTARWNVLANQVIFAQHDQQAGPGREFNGDKWDGYVADRQAVLDLLAQGKSGNVVVITGDIHQNRVYDLKADFNDPESPTVGAEFVGTSISSGGDVAPNTIYSSSDNPHLRFRNSNRGYVRCEVTPSRWQADYRVVSTVRSRNATLTTLASFVVEDGRPGVQRA